MKRQLLALSVSLAFVAVPSLDARAGTSDTGPGCGLGKVAWEDSKLGQGIAPQLFMSTTNAFTMPFAITTGTLGCKNDGKLWAEDKARVFVKLNPEDLSQDMARGEGEHLASLATLLGVPAEQQPAFFALTQSQYPALAEASRTSPEAMLLVLHRAMAADPALAQVALAR